MAQGLMPSTKPAIVTKGKETNPPCLSKKQATAVQVPPMEIILHYPFSFDNPQLPSEPLLRLKPNNAF